MTRTRLVDLLDHTNGLFRLADSIHWQYLEDSSGKTFQEGPGRPPTSTRLIIGLHLLKYLENKSDEEVVRGFVQNLKKIWVFMLLREIIILVCLWSQRFRFLICVSNKH